MTTETFFDKYKKIMLPHIKDWTKEYNNKRFRKDWWNMHWIEMFVFHAQIYKWTLGGIAFISSIVFSSVTVIFYLRGNMIGAVIFFLLDLFMLRSSYRKLKTWKIKHIINFYDLFFKEYTLK